MLRAGHPPAKAVASKPGVVSRRSPFAREGMTTSRFIVKPCGELIALRGGMPTNFASLLQVCCLHDLSMSTEREGRECP
jgi:predicted DNA-binding ribbon-helix-helix protein